jgi:protein-disulfide isomerase
MSIHKNKTEKLEIEPKKVHHKTTSHPHKTEHKSEHKAAQHHKTNHHKIEHKKENSKIEEKLAETIVLEKEKMGLKENLLEPENKVILEENLNQQISQNKPSQIDVEVLIKTPKLNSKSQKVQEENFWSILMSSILISSSIIIFFILFLLGFGWSDYHSFKQAKAAEIEELRNQNNSLITQQQALDQQIKAVNTAKADPERPKMPTTLTNIPKPNFQTEVFKGKQNADIILIEYSDLQCPFCAKIQPDIDKLVNEFPEIASVYRHYALIQIHPNAIPYAQGGECFKEQKGNPGFYSFINQIFTLKPEITKMGEIASNLGGDKNTFETCMSSNKFKNKVELDSQNSSNLLGSNGFGTPTSILFNTKNGNNKIISGALPYDQLKLELQNFKNSN